MDDFLLYDFQQISRFLNFHVLGSQDRDNFMSQTLQTSVRVRYSMINCFKKQLVKYVPADTVYVYS